MMRLSHLRWRLISVLRASTDLRLEVCAQQALAFADHHFVLSIVISQKDNKAICHMLAYYLFLPQLSINSGGKVYH